MKSNLRVTATDGASTSGALLRGSEGIQRPARPPVTSAELSAAMAACDLRGSAATVVGIGTMGKHYVAALHALGVPRVRLVSRSAGPLEAFSRVPGVETVPGGVERLTCRPEPDELGIIATPTAMLLPAAERLASLGFRHLLIEKPASLWSDDIERLAERF